MEDKPKIPTDDEIRKLAEALYFKRGGYTTDAIINRISEGLRQLRDSTAAAYEQIASQK